MKTNEIREIRTALISDFCRTKKVADLASVCMRPLECVRLGTMGRAHVGAVSKSSSLLTRAVAWLEWSILLSGLAVACLECPIRLAGLGGLCFRGPACKIENLTCGFGNLAHGKEIVGDLFPGS